MSGFRRLGLEVWLALAVYALDKALGRCRMPEDERLVVAINDAARPLIHLASMRHPGRVESRS